VEQAGIPTVTLNNFRPHAECVRPPRVVHLTDYPFGAQWGPPKMLDMQRIVVEDALQALVSIQVPGTIIDLPHRWGDARRGLLQRYLR
jgi:hypothetical protein